MSKRVTLQQLGGELTRLVNSVAKNNAQAVKTEIEQWPNRVRTRAVGHYGSTGLQVRSGQLRNQMQGFTRQQGNSVELGLSNPKVYAAIHEFGGTIPPHIIEPRVKKALAWPGMQGGPYAVVRHPGGVIRKTEFMSEPVRNEGMAMVERLKKAEGFE